MLCIVPSVSLALTSFEGAELRYASGLFNLMRNLGGAIQIAVVNTWPQDNARIAMARFGEALGHRAQALNDAIADIKFHPGPVSNGTPPGGRVRQPAQAARHPPQTVCRMLLAQTVRLWRIFAGGLA